MRIPTPIQALSAAAALALLAGCSSGSAIAPKPSTLQGHGQVNARLAHAFVAPGIRGGIAVASRGVQPDFVATKPCTYLSDNVSGTVQVYNANLTLAGTISASGYGYGWGVLAVNTTTRHKVFIGTNNGTGNIDMYKPCSSTKTGTISGNSTGGNPYGIAGFKKAGAPGYATDWPSNQINYWATCSGSPVAMVDPNLGLPYFLDVDKAGNLYVVGYDTTFGFEEMDKCSSSVTNCKVLVQISTGNPAFPGGVQVDVHNNIYLNNQYGFLTSYKCPLGVCTQTGAFTYSTGNGNPLDYTAIALDPASLNTLWGANIYNGSPCPQSHLCGDAQPQSLPLNSAILGTPTPQWVDTSVLGVARFLPDKP